MKRLNLTGQKYGRLLVLAPAENRKWKCLCDCGKEHYVAIGNLRNGHTKSCGCLDKEKCLLRGTHRMSKTPEFKSWTGMIERCLRKKCPAYKYYGNRGIRICERWMKFENFFEDMGKKPSPDYSIERIDNNGNYEPKNCRWATKVDQSRNKRTNIILEFNGEKMVLSQWAMKVGIKEQTLGYRIRKGWSVEEAITKPVSKGRSLGGINAQKARRIKFSHYLATKAKKSSSATESPSR